ncbi:hypothetical protein B7463_g9268, partial [Scytalidium lignicola]
MKVSQIILFSLGALAVSAAPAEPKEPTIKALSHVGNIKQKSTIQKTKIESLNLLEARARDQISTARRIQVSQILPLLNGLILSVISVEPDSIDGINPPALTGAIQTSLQTLSDNVIASIPNTDDGLPDNSVAIAGGLVIGKILENAADHLSTTNLVTLEWQTVFIAAYRALVNLAKDQIKIAFGVLDPATRLVQHLFDLVMAVTEDF